MTVNTPPLIGVLMCQSNQDEQLILTVENLYLAPLYHSGAVAIPLPHHLADDPLYLAAALKSLSGIFLPVARATLSRTTTARRRRRPATIRGATNWR